MYIKKAGGKVFGVRLTNAEKTAMDIEIKRQLADFDRKHMLEIDAIVLWVLHEQLGFGPARLKKFYDSFSDDLEALIKRYELTPDDKVWLCTKKLKEIGVDIDAWDRDRSVRKGTEDGLIFEKEN